MVKKLSKSLAAKGQNSRSGGKRRAGIRQNFMNGGGEVVLYQAPDGKVQLDVRLERETVWLTQAQMAELFGRERSVITKHIGTVFRERELDAKTVCANFARTAEDGKTYQVREHPHARFRGDRKATARFTRPDVSFCRSSKPALIHHCLLSGSPKSRDSARSKD